MCPRCGAKRNEGHNWSKNCEQCSRCGKTRTAGHDWNSECQQCARCRLRRTAVHDFTKDCEKCALCTLSRTAAHDWSKGCEKCSRCGSLSGSKRAERATDRAAKVALDQEHIPEKESLPKISNPAPAPPTPAPSHFAPTSKSILDAAEKGKLEDVKFWLAKNPTSIRDRDSTYWCSTPLHLAATEGHKEVVEVLLSHGADADAKDGNGWGPMHFAAERGYGDCNLPAESWSRQLQQQTTLDSCGACSEKGLQRRCQSYPARSSVQAKGLGSFLSREGRFCRTREDAR